VVYCRHAEATEEHRNIESEPMVDFFSIIKIAPEAIRAYLFNRKHKRELLSDFVLDAIGLQECLSPDSYEAGTLSFVTIDLRMRLLQENEPGRASKCGVPAVGDAKRGEKIRNILREMVSAGKLHRCRKADRWKVLSGDSGRQLRA
jgi:hypothetical protein